jgi:Mor family transcriptional regulator
MLKAEFTMEKDFYKESRDHIEKHGSVKPSTPAREESSALFLQREMQDILKTELGLLPEFAAPIAHAIVCGLRKRAGRQSIYIPGPVDIAQRNAQIKREFNGTNRVEVCRKHNISRSRLYQIVGG